MLALPGGRPRREGGGGGGRGTRILNRDLHGKHWSGSLSKRPPLLVTFRYFCTNGEPFAENMISEMMIGRSESQKFYGMYPKAKRNLLPM